MVRGPRAGVHFTAEGQQFAVAGLQAGQAGADDRFGVKPPQFQLVLVGPAEARPAVVGQRFHDQVRITDLAAVDVTRHPGLFAIVADGRRRGSAAGLPATAAGVGGNVVRSGRMAHPAGGAAGRRATDPGQCQERDGRCQLVQVKHPHLADPLTSCACQLETGTLTAAGADGIGRSGFLLGAI